MKPTFLDEHGTEGADGLCGTEFPDCGWYFGGYALPLLDPIENHARATSLTDTCANEAGWTSFADRHGTTTNPCTLLIRGLEVWRTYFQSPALAADVTGDNTFPVAPAGVGLQRYPDDDDTALWTNSNRFSKAYVSFLDSPDGGLTFPIYAPTVHPVRYDQTATGTHCVKDADGWDTTNADFTNAGWSQTCLPCESVTPDVDGVYTIYRNVSVFDFYEEWGVYVMCAVECRSTYSYPATDGCDPCGFGSAEGCPAPTALPYTRYVMFLSDTPDFLAWDATTGSGTWPDPLLHTQALVLSQPDAGADGPAVGVAPNEFYGVSHAIHSPDRNTILLYLGWSLQYDAVIGADPERFTNFYGALTATLGWNKGLSAIRYDADTLISLALLTEDADVTYGVGSVESTSLRAFVARLAQSFGYHGEVLVTTGAVASAGNLETVNAIDATFAWCGSCPGQLRAYWDQPNGDSMSKLPQDQLWQAVSGGVDNIRPILRPPAALRNGPDTIFITPDECGMILDMRDLGLSSAETPLVTDPDVAVLGSGRIRVADNCGSADWPGGLVVAWGPPSACDAVTLPTWETVTEVAVRRPSQPAEVFAALAAGDGDNAYLRVVERALAISSLAARAPKTPRREHLRSAWRAACGELGAKLPEPMLRDRPAADVGVPTPAVQHPVSRLLASAPREPGGLTRVMSRGWHSA